MPEDILPRRGSIGANSVAGERLQLLEMTAQPWGREIDKGTDFRHRKAPLRRDEMDRERPMLTVAQDDRKRALLDLLSHVVGEHSRDAVARYR